MAMGRQSEAMAGGVFNSGSTTVLSINDDITASRLINDVKPCLNKEHGQELPWLADSAQSGTEIKRQNAPTQPSRTGACYHEARHWVIVPQAEKNIVWRYSKNTGWQSAITGHLDWRGTRSPQFPATMAALACITK